MATPFDILKHINSKDGLEFDMKDYNSFMINRGLSNNLDTLFFADVINKHSHLDKDIQYRFYFDAIPKGKRFGKWHKSLAINTDVEVIMETYKVNQRVAEGYLKLMNESAINLLHKKNNRGGSK
jgi:hypothetical protein